MEKGKRYGIKNILLTSFWICLGAGMIVLLVAAIRKKDARNCQGIDITISGVNNNFFVDKGDILNTITALSNGNPVGRPTGSFNLKKMEAELEKNVWIKEAQMFFDNNETLFVKVKEREPVARIFSTPGSTFYIDEETMILPLSEKFSARLPVFTGFPTDAKVLSAADSSLLLDIRNISGYIQKDSFLMAMIEQVDITPQRNFDMIPKIGKQVIVFGDASDIAGKMSKLKLFYRNVMVKAGWQYYSTINLQYKDQVVAKRWGAEDIAADSMRTLQLMQLIAANAERQASDSLQNRQSAVDNNMTDSTMIQQSIQRDDNGEPGELNEVQPVSRDQQAATKVPVSANKDAKPASPQSPANRAKKPVPVKPAVQKPKAAMPEKNEP